MVIGISPVYNYPGTFEQWWSNNTLYASNHGGSLITRAIMREFDAEYVSDFSNIDALNEKYDVCYLALATHVNPTRDVAFFANIVKQLKMKVIAPSLGIKDYIQLGSDAARLHPSVIALLSEVSNKSAYLGARGPYTAEVLKSNGFENVVEVGCPTLYMNLKRSFELKKPESFKRPLNVYHKTYAEILFSMAEKIPFLGQDFQDEAIFTDHLKNDTVLMNMEQEFYQQAGLENEIEKIAQEGVFFSDFENWYSYIAAHDFVFGPRLHGNIAAMLQGIPALFIWRDLRVKEMSEFYSFPALSYEEAQTKNINELYDTVEIAPFLKRYTERYDNYLNFIKLNDLQHQLEE